ncbi:MAG: hypothetical protein ACRDDY_10800 [Clostridium sp.]|uniref:hypothetical protein n=1 Tax=Clostridium sp. TaxID=1506 RepID=UPI003EE6EDBC
MKYELTNNFTEITDTKPFTIQCKGGLGVEICTGDTPVKGEGITLNLGEREYCDSAVKVWARALGTATEKATITVVGF